MGLVDLAIVFFNGFLLGASLIIAIGSQNAFVFQQGISRNHVFLVCTICFLGDALLIMLGGLGLSRFISSSETLLFILFYGGAIYLFVYGSVKLVSAFRNDSALSVSEDKNSSHRGSPRRYPYAVAVNTLMVTFLNPHVYLDTVVLIGSVASKYSSVHRGYFLLGCCVASFTWFFSLGFGASKLAPFLKKPFYWKIINFAIAMVMYYIGLLLLLGVEELRS